MESVFCKARPISKSLKGNRGSVIRYAQYLDRTLAKTDFSDKGKLLASGIDGTEETPLAFWKKAEERELQTKRKKTARFAKEYIVGLPHNLPIEEMEKVSKAISAELSKGGRVVSWYLHEPDKNEDEISKNYHCHFLLSEREYNQETKEFAEAKNRDWNTRATLQSHKKTIGEKINERLRALNLPEWKIELTEEEKKEREEKRGEERKATERRRKKEVAKCDRKIKLAEVKLDGLGRGERGLANSVDGNSKSDNELAEQFKNFNKFADEFADFQRAADSAERLERAKQEELQRKPEQDKIDSERRNQQSAINSQNSNEQFAEYRQPKRKPIEPDWDIGY